MLHGMFSLLRRYVEYEMLRVLAGWLPATARMELKLAIGRLLWEDAQHVQHLYGRLREIRVRARLRARPSGSHVPTHTHSLLSESA